LRHCKPKLLEAIVEGPAEAVQGHRVRAREEGMKWLTGHSRRHGYVECENIVIEGFWERRGCGWKRTMGITRLTGPEYEVMMSLNVHSCFRMRPTLNCSSLQREAQLSRATTNMDKSQRVTRSVPEDRLAPEIIRRITASSTDT
jgi:hypothetical protein